MEAWYVAKTKPKKERWVEKYLTDEMGIDVFLPNIRTPANGKLKYEPLFPTYLFCYFDQRSSAWPAIRWVPGLCYFLATGQYISPVPDELIYHLKERVSRWNDRRSMPRFSPGDSIIVIDGPFSNLEGIFQRYIPARQRCHVLIQVLGQLNKVELPAEVLRFSSSSHNNIFLS